MQDGSVKIEMISLKIFIDEMFDGPTVTHFKDISTGYTDFTSRFYPANGSIQITQLTLTHTHATLLLILERTHTHILVHTQTNELQHTQTHQEMRIVPV